MASLMGGKSNPSHCHWAHEAIQYLRSLAEDVDDGEDGRMGGWKDGSMGRWVDGCQTGKAKMVTRSELVLRAVVFIMACRKPKNQERSPSVLILLCCKSWGEEKGEILLDEHIGRINVH